MGETSISTPRKVNTRNLKITHGSNDRQLRLMNKARIHLSCVYTLPEENWIKERRLSNVSTPRLQLGLLFVNVNLDSVGLHNGGYGQIQTTLFNLT